MTHADTPVFWYFTVAIMAMFLTCCIIVGLVAAAVRGIGNETEG